MNYKAGVREEKWGMLDLKNVQFPKTIRQSVKRATLLQHFEADFIRAMGIISPAAAAYGQAVLAGVHRDLPVYRRQDDSTTNKDWTEKTVEEVWHGRAEAAVNLALQSAGISQECMDIARMLRHDPPVRPILMTAYHRLLPHQSSGGRRVAAVRQRTPSGRSGSSIHLPEATSLEGCSPYDSL